MKRLLVLRHAKSSWKDPDLPDHDRPLNKRGRHDALLMGKLLKYEDLKPDLIISSSAGYSPHHEPFQYYVSTANPHHLSPKPRDIIGKTDQANHQYDLIDFWNAAEIGNLPAVSFLKAAAYQDGHSGYSNPLDEQTFLVDTINHLQKLAEWNSTAVIIAYDDSDGWYDHVMPPIVSQSNDPKYDRLLGENGLCGQAPAGNRSPNKLTSRNS
jgi:phospholipase C